jgi:hypothetical protein
MGVPLTGGFTGGEVRKVQVEGPTVGVWVWCLSPVGVVE